MAPLSRIGFLLLAFLQGSVGLNWTSSGTIPNGTIIPACSGQDVTLAWSYTADVEEHLMNVEWHFGATGGKETILATQTMGSFFAVPNTAHKLQFIPNAGIRIQNVDKEDSGTYTVHVNINVHGSVVTDVQTLDVQVSDSSLTTDGQLHVRMLPEAVYDNSTQQFHVQLACGDFSPVWAPRVAVVWKLPNNQTLSSTSSDSGRFLLSVPDPVISGEYTCAIDNTSPASLCVQSDSPIKRGSTISVDGVDSRFIQIEAKMKFMQLQEEDMETRHRQDIAALEVSHRQELSTLETKHQRELSTLTAQMNSTHAALREKDASLEDKISLLTTKLEKAVQQVYFYAVPSAIKTHNYDLFDSVVHNVGSGYNVGTGRFTAPVSGLYLFLVTADSASYVTNVKTTLYVSNGEYVSALGMGDASGSNQLVVHLSVGQYVYVSLNKGWLETQHDSSFVGVLIQADI